MPLNWRFTVGFIIIFSISTFCLYFYMSYILAEQTKATIREDMEKLQSFAYDHIQQYALVNQGNEQIEKDGITPLLYGISRSTGHPIAYYDKDGIFIGETLFTKNGSVRLELQPSTILSYAFEADRALSLDNKSVVTMTENNGKHLVLLTFPYYSNDRYEGFFRMTSDYSSRYKHNDAILRSFSWFAAVLFVVVTLFTYILSSRMTRPLFKLSLAMRGFGEGKQTDAYLPIDRRDEVGQLSLSFEQMKGQIEDQLAHLIAERNRVMELEQSKRRFYQHITHELKTPLTSISGYAQIIGKPDFNDPVFLARAAERIKLESDRLHSMVVQVLELARREDTDSPQSVVPIDLSAQLEACCEDMEIKALRYDMKLECELQAAVTVLGHQEELRQVWVNLLDNSIKYGAAGTSIHVKAALTAERAVVQVSNERDQEQPIDEQMVFEPFYRVNDSLVKDHGSMGLGLAICQSIIGSHRGMIAFRQEGRQVHVQVELPLWT
ncbi:sensor histidine kinase [Paenibacillus radicis (ex Gao et al. 2016)]|uniref:histidine kinase n=1 Tax=Paenibacillus radicis (ex Gao et al. 2016) TaxID=1737354 RepID=A0A917LY03_9BACL|nr:sensor histidine kinase [Paenibacillus radicis (ex Gao et al. 2016)]